MARRRGGGPSAVACRVTSPGGEPPQREGESEDVDARVAMKPSVRPSVWSATNVPTRSTGSGLPRRRTVRTDRLVSVRTADGVAQRLVPRDSAGCRVEIDPQVPVADPAWWHRVSEDVRGRLERGLLVSGEKALPELGRRVDRETARRVFEVSGLGPVATAIATAPGPGPGSANAEGGPPGHRRAARRPCRIPGPPPDMGSGGGPGPSRRRGAGSPSPDTGAAPQ
ncbi:hypothetical protein [Streptomyces sp. NPDC007883]|uniref:hypothetical protein n=1 Tax=Streptomyces sp. NPDC007883 TaxID=3155116 RepID=UPI0033DD3E12